MAKMYMWNPKFEIILGQKVGFFFFNDEVSAVTSQKTNDGICCQR